MYEKGFISEKFAKDLGIIKLQSNEVNDTSETVVNETVVKNDVTVSNEVSAE